MHGNAYALKCTVPTIPYNMVYIYKIIYHIRRDLISVTPSQVKVFCKYLNLGTHYVLLFFSYLKKYPKRLPAILSLAGRGTIESFTDYEN